MQIKTERTGIRDIDVAFAVMTGTLLLGVVLGTLSFCFMPKDMTDMLSAAVRDFTGFRQSAGFGHILIDSFFVTTLFIAAEFILGLSALGHLPELLVLIYRGSGLGIILSQAYVSTEPARLPVVILFIVPALAVSSYALCLAAKEAVKMSGHLLGLMLTGEGSGSLPEHFRSFLTRYAALEALAAVSAAVDCLCSVFIAPRI